MGFIQQGSQQKTTQTSKQELSPQGQALQQILSRFMMNRLQQGPQSFGDFRQSGYRAYPATPISLQEGMALDPFNIDPGLRGMTQNFNPAGFLTLPGVMRANPTPGQPYDPTNPNQQWYDLGSQLFNLLQMRNPSLTKSAVKPKR